MPNILDEYLVKLGAVVDQSGMAKFHNALREASAAVGSNALGMTSAFFKAQTAIVGGFVAIGSAALGLADKVAMADQEYRLFAMHMYMSKDAARGLKVAMDALGQPLENLSWDPELRDRTRQLLADQSAMAPSGDFEGQMHKIRDVRFEFTRMEVELQYLGMHVVQDFMKALGMGPDDLLRRLQKFNDWVTHNLPDISKRIVTDFLPVWRDVESIMRSTGEAIESAALLFTDLVGLFTGDNSIVGTTLSFEKMAAAIQDVAGGFSEVAQLMADLEKLLIHLSVAASYLAPGNFHPAKAWEELKTAGRSISTKEGLEIIGGAAGMAFGGPMGAAAGAIGMHVIGNSAEYAARGFQGDPRAPSTGRTLIQSLAEQLGIRPELAHALFKAESGEAQLDSNGHLKTSHDSKGNPVAYGIAQLTRGTAADLGVDVSNEQQNAAGGMRLLKYYLKKYNDEATAIAAYHEGGAKMDAILAGRATLSAEARSEVSRVMTDSGSKGSIHIGNINVSVSQTNASPKDISSATIKGFVDYLRNEDGKRSQRNQQEFSQLSGWSY